MKKESGDKWKKRVNVCFGKNDLRCVAEKELDGEIAYRTGKAVVEFLGAKQVLVGHDIRESSHMLRDAFISGVRDYGADAIDLGAIDTPEMYFASGKLGLPGGMITASHNPAKYNGIKLVRSGAFPIGEKTGMYKIREIVMKDKFGRVGEIGKRGKLINKNIHRAYRKHVLSFVDVKKLKGLRVTIDAGNGMAGIVVPRVYPSSIKIHKLGFKPDGSFPRHDANPVKPKNLRHLILDIKKHKSDFGIAFDTDMDRAVFVDESGVPVDSGVIAALLIKKFLQEKSGTSFVFNPTMSRIVGETISKFKGKGILEKTGHTFIKDRMRREDAGFGAENSGHYYFKKNYFADSGIITSLLVSSIFKESGKKFSELISEFRKYYKIPETSVKVKDRSRVLNYLERKYSKGASRVLRLDGLSFYFDDYWFNVRASNTEPLIRVNAEASDAKKLKREVRKLLQVIKNV